jgi:hypothetical protein
LKHKFQLFCLIASLGAGPASAQVAYVYVPSTDGIFAYDASSAGKLTPIEGSPFKETSGLAIGTNGKYFVTVGTDWVHSYEVASNGAIGKQVSEINTQNYGGSQCGTTAGGKFNHNGIDIFVQLAGATDSDGNLVCDDIQTYSINSKGELTFKGDLAFSKESGSVAPAGLPTFVGTTKYGVNLEQFPNVDDQDPGDISSYFNIFETESSGAIEPAPNAGVSGPEAGGGNGGYRPYAFTADPTDHLAVMLQSGIGSYGCFCQMASFTMTNGKLVSTNTWKNMPYWPDTWTGAMLMSPSGKLLALGVFPGVQLYHFNGASPITAYTGIIGESSGHVGQIAWDNDNHLYAINDSSRNLHVYNATPTSVKEVAGSPLLIPDNAQPTGLIVRSN